MRNPISIHSEDRSPSETSHLCSLAGCDGVVDRSADPDARSASLPTRWLASGGDVLGGRAGASGTVRCSRAGAGRALAERRERELGAIAVTAHSFARGGQAPRICWKNSPTQATRPSHERAVPRGGGASIGVRVVGAAAGASGDACFSP